MKRRNADLAIPAIFANSKHEDSRNRRNSWGKNRKLDLNLHLKESAKKLNSLLNAQEGTRSLITEEWLDSVEAAAYLRVSIGALRNMTSNGEIPFYKMGKRNRYRTEELRQLLLSNKRGASNGN